MNTLAPRFQHGLLHAAAGALNRPAPGGEQAPGTEPTADADAALAAHRFALSSAAQRSLADFPHQGIAPDKIYYLSAALAADSPERGIAARVCAPLSETFVEGAARRACTVAAHAADIPPDAWLKCALADPAYAAALPISELIRLWEAVKPLAQPELMQMCAEVCLQAAALGRPQAVASAVALAEQILTQSDSRGPGEGVDVHVATRLHVLLLKTNRAARSLAALEREAVAILSDAAEALPGQAYVALRARAVALLDGLLAPAASAALYGGVPALINAVWPMGATLSPPDVRALDDATERFIEQLPVRFADPALSPQTYLKAVEEAAALVLRNEGSPRTALLRWMLDAETDRTQTNGQRADKTSALERYSAALDGATYEVGRRHAALMLDQGQADTVEKVLINRIFYAQLSGSLEVWLAFALQRGPDDPTNLSNINGRVRSLVEHAEGPDLLAGVRRLRASGPLPAEFWVVLGQAVKDRPGPEAQIALAEIFAASPEAAQATQGDLLVRLAESQDIATQVAQLRALGSCEHEAGPERIIIELLRSTADGRAAVAGHVGEIGAPGLQRDAALRILESATATEVPRLLLALRDAAHATPILARYAHQALFDAANATSLADTEAHAVLALLAHAQAGWLARAAPGAAPAEAPAAAETAVQAAAVVAAEIVAAQPPREAPLGPAAAAPATAPSSTPRRRRPPLAFAIDA